MRVEGILGWLEAILSQSIRSAGVMVDPGAVADSDRRRFLSGEMLQR
jgi:hypothetical protein